MGFGQPSPYPLLRGILVQREIREMQQFHIQKPERKNTYTPTGGGGGGAMVLIIRSYFISTFLLKVSFPPALLGSFLSCFKLLGEKALAFSIGIFMCKGQAPALTSLLWSSSPRCINSQNKGRTSSLLRSKSSCLSCKGSPYLKQNRS